MPFIHPVVAYIPEYSYEFGYSHVLFVWKLESSRPKLKKQKKISPLLRDLADPLTVVERTPWISSAEKTDGK